MRIKYPKILIIISAQIFLFLLISCSGVSTGKMSESYLSPEYEDKSFENVSMDVCYPYPQYELIPGSDTTHFQTLVEFDMGFKNYFPDGIMLFSTITKVGWVYFEVNYEADIIEYQIKTEDNHDFYMMLPDSLSIFQRKSDADFLFIIQSGMFTQKPPDFSYPKSRYSTIYEIEYSIWDRKNSELVTKDKVSSKIEFDRLGNNWPYRAAITKSAALIFEKLPMFQK